MNYKVVLACTSGVSSEVMAKKMRAVVAVNKMPITIQESATDEKTLDALKDVQVLLLSPQIGYMVDDLRAKYPDTIVKVISERDYSVMDGEALLDQVVADLDIVANMDKPKPKHIVLLCTEGFSASGIAQNMRSAIEKMDVAVEVDIEPLAAAAVDWKNPPHVDLILLAPGVTFMKDDFKVALPEGTPVLEIDGVDYGTANGTAIMEKALAALK